MMFFMNEVILKALFRELPEVEAWHLKIVADAIEARLIETCWYTPTTMFSQSEITRAAG